MDIILYNGNMLLHTQSYEELDGQSQGGYVSLGPVHHPHN